MINVSSNIATTLITDIAIILSQLWVIFAILISLTITFYIIRKIIFLFIIAKR